ncbi:LysR family transcriptional regulator [Bifidobacterium tissieri]|uniref:LysR family transcriptional regulator n=2 Tax=Bifidobacterium tissieri TaxID=1630162 RepID=A0A5M9ZV75_9BIFI|nr:LysR family transcriptional regulator [Bifidobacterium tissieri]KAA8831524.1 LysR family transcriptional regulator [Bifidobacterium tissieri]KAA8832490.1 LysR family transcriptional regulator [Bifidobacterium tissieri]
MEVRTMASIDNVRDMELFQLVAELGSFTDAAAAARVSQPTVSLAIKRLEQRLGVTLVERHRFGAKGGVSLTEAGLVLMRHTASILGELDRLTEELQQADHASRYNVGLPPIISAYLLGAESIDTLASRLGGEVDVQSVGSRRLMRQIERHAVDFGAVASVGSAPSVGGIQTFRIASFPFVLAYAADNPHGVTAIMGDRTVFDISDPAMTGSLRFVTLGDDFVHSKAATAYLRSHVDATRLIEVSDVNTMKAIIISGLAVGLMASVAVDHDDRLSSMPVVGADLPDFDVYVFNDETREGPTRDGDGEQHESASQRFLGIIGEHLASR